MKFSPGLIITLSLLMTCSISCKKANSQPDTINLPAIKIASDKPFLKLLQDRLSVRSFRTTPLSLNDISLILWVASGKKIEAVSSASRTVPSAGACHPIETFLLVQEKGVSGIKPGLYFYSPDDHQLKLIAAKIDRNEVVKACFGQNFITESPVLLIISAIFKKTTLRYGERGQRYVYLDAGHVAQNVYLIITQLKLATVEIGAFDDQTLARSLKLPNSNIPILVMPVGYPK